MTKEEQEEQKDLSKFYREWSNEDVGHLDNKDEEVTELENRLKYAFQDCKFTELLNSQIKSIKNEEEV